MSAPARTSTSRLRSKTSDLSEFLRGGRAEHRQPESSLPVPSLPDASLDPQSKGKHKISFFGRRRKSSSVSPAAAKAAESKAQQEGDVPPVPYISMDEYSPRLVSCQSLNNPVLFRYMRGDLARSYAGRLESWHTRAVGIALHAPGHDRQMSELGGWCIRDRPLMRAGYASYRATSRHPAYLHSPEEDKLGINEAICPRSVYRRPWSILSGAIQGFSGSRFTCNHRLSFAIYILF